MRDKRNSYQDRKWREACFQRDRMINARCWRCKQPIDYSRKQANSADPDQVYDPEAYEPDHEKSYHSHPQLRYVISNGKPCHARCNRHAGAMKGAEADPNEWMMAEDWSE